MPLNPLSAVELSEADNTALAWLRAQKWTTASRLSGRRFATLNSHEAHKSGLHIDVNKLPEGQELASPGSLDDLAHKLAKAGVIALREDMDMPLKKTGKDLVLYLHDDDLKNLGVTLKTARKRKSYTEEAELPPAPVVKRRYR